MLGSEQFPMFRLVTQLARQLSSPIASQIKEYARQHPTFGRAVCVRAGRSVRALELRCKLWSLRLPPPRAAPPLSDARALEAGADFIGEAILFSMLASIIMYEVNRKALAKEDLELREESRVLAVTLQLHELQHELALQQQELDRLQAALARRGDHAPMPSPVSPPPLPSPPPPFPPTLTGPGSSPASDSRLSCPCPCQPQPPPRCETAPASPPPC